MEIPNYALVVATTQRSSFVNDATVEITLDALEHKHLLTLLSKNPSGLSTSLQHKLVAAPSFAARGTRPVWATKLLGLLALGR